MKISCLEQVKFITIYFKLFCTKSALCTECFHGYVYVAPVHEKNRVFPETLGKDIALCMGEKNNQDGVRIPYYGASGLHIINTSVTQSRLSRLVVYSLGNIYVSS